MCFNAYLAGDPEDRQGVRLLLAGLDDGPLPERTSLAQLEEIYRRRANLWDQGAVGPTGYRGHALVAGLLERLNGGARGLDIIDAGCGTGLVGRLVAAKARRLVGVDASRAMLDKAKDKDVYHQLCAAENYGGRSNDLTT